MLRIRPTTLLVISLMSCSIGAGQDTDYGRGLPLKAILVLTPTFCATNTKEGAWAAKEKFELGKPTCAELEPALRRIFSSLTRTEEEPISADAQVILTPKFLDVTAHRTGGGTAFDDYVSLVEVEWTAKDRSGKTVWIEIVQTSAKHKIGTAFSYKKNLRTLLDDSAKNLAQESVRRIAQSAELRRLATLLGQN